ncbi:MAG: TonB-dependent receptor [Bacteroidia bacterium]|nr:TonB-dependent receptor [Bacteroidia bacterium]
MRLKLNILKRILLFFLTALISISSFCQLDTIKLNEVEIKDRFPLFSVIKRTEVDSLRIMRSINANLGDVLNFEPGLTVKHSGDGSLATVSFRGTDASHTKFDWNGMPVNSSMNGQVDFSLIPICATDKINILYGANSLTTGSGALGGIVSLNSPTFENIKQGAEFKQEVGSFGLINSYLAFSLVKNNVKSNTAFSFHRSDNNFKYDNIAILPKEEMTQHNAEFERINLKEELFYKKGFNEFSLKLWLSSAHREIPVIMTNVMSSKHEETQGDKSTRILASWNYQHNCLRYFIKQGFSYTNLNYVLNQYSGNNIVSFINSHSNETQYYTVIGARYCLTDEIKINASANYSLQNAKIFEEKYSQGYNVLQNVIDGMADIELSPYKWLNMSVLSRVKKHGDYKPVIIPALFISAKLSKVFQFKSSLSHNVNFPTFNDLYFVPGGNPDLKPEKGLQSDITFEYNSKFGKNKTGNEIKSEIGFFYTNINSWILWQPSQYGYWMPQNIRNMVSKGIQFKSSLARNFNNIKIILITAYTYNIANANDADYITEQLPYLPKHTANAAFNLNYKNVSFNAEEIFTDKKTTSFYNHDLNPLFLTNISTSYLIKFKKFTLNTEIRLNNLFNEKYQLVQWRPMPGRNASIVISIKI